VRVEQIRLGARVEVDRRHRIAERRGKPGTVVGRYGREDYVAVDVRFSDGACRLFWPRDLEEISSPEPAWWRFLVGWRSAE
jgi:hypothetical protein